MPATETESPLLQVVVSQAVNFSQIRYGYLGHYSGNRTGLIATATLASEAAQWNIRQVLDPTSISADSFNDSMYSMFFQVHW